MKKKQHFVLSEQAFSREHPALWIERNGELIKIATFVSAEAARNFAYMETNLRQVNGID